MILIYKKKNIFIGIILFFSIIFYLLFTYFILTPDFAVTKPVNNYTIILDAGHGYPDGGATNYDGTIIESNLNLSIVLRLQNLLESVGINVILTRADENGIYDSNITTIRKKKISDLENRVKIANISNASLFLSIHMNKLPQTQYFGWQCFYKNNNEKSKNFANEIQESLNSFMEKENNRKIKPISEIYLAKNIKIPFVLVECGFLSNVQESILLTNSSYQDNLAWSIFIGLMNSLQK